MDEKMQTNSYSIASLTLGILSIIIPFIGLILGVIGVFVSIRAKKEMVGSTGLATSGLICCVVGIVFQILMVLSFLVFATMTTVG